VLIFKVLTSSPLLFLYSIHPEIPFGAHFTILTLLFLYLTHPRHYSDQTASALTSSEPPIGAHFKNPTTLPCTISLSDKFTTLHLRIHQLYMSRPRIGTLNHVYNSPRLSLSLLPFRNITLLEDAPAALDQCPTISSWTHKRTWSWRERPRDTGYGKMTDLRNSAAGASSSSSSSFYLEAVKSKVASLRG